MQTQKKPRPSRADRNAAKQAKARETQAVADQKAQIAKRVAPEPRKPNEIKKVYKEGSPGFNRKQRGVTLTQVKNGINETAIKVSVEMDEDGTILKETTETYRDTGVCTRRRRFYQQQGLIGRSSKSRKQRRKCNRVAAVGTRGKNPPKKPWHKAKKAA